MLQNLDLLQNLDMLQNFDMLQNLDILQGFDMLVAKCRASLDAAGKDVTTIIG